MKKKMSNAKFRGLTIPFLAVFSVVAIGITAAANYFQSTLETFVGKGGYHIETPNEKKNWDSTYYSLKEDDNSKTIEANYKIANNIQDEGTVLLKNNGVLPLSKNTTVMPYGYRYINPIYGQVSSSGSGKWVIGNQITPEQNLKTYFNVNEDAVNKMNNAEVIQVGSAPNTLGTGGTSALGGDNSLYEYDANTIYNSLTKVSDSTGLVFIGRVGQEGTDLKYDAYEDGTKHQLALSSYEKATIKKAKEINDKVILIVESSAPLEYIDVMQGELEVDAILLVGHTGERGFSRLGAILTGEVNPSGRTVDIYPVDFTKDPTYQNFGDFYYTNATVTTYAYGDFPHYDENGNKLRSYVEYQEGIYYGYRYYETYDAIDDNFVYGALDGKGAIETLGAVAYPFGYGLSYTSFDKEIVKFDDNNDEVKIEVKVTNTGNVAGKEVVQIYYTSPYTQYDIDNKIEKASTNLIDFNKTKLLNPNESQILTLSFNKEDLASYSFNHLNNDGTKGSYILEAGNYNIELKNNSHDVIDSKILKINETKIYEGQDLRKFDKDAQSKMDDNGNILDYPAKKEADNSINSYVTVHNLFDDLTDYMFRQSSVLSRNNWHEIKVESRTKIADQLTLDLAKNDKNTFDVENDPLLGNNSSSVIYHNEKPISNQNNNLTLIDLRGKSYMIHYGKII